MAAFLTAVGGYLVADVAEGVLAAAGAGTAALAVIVFMALVGRHRRVRREERRQEYLRRMAVEGLLRLERRWAELAEALPSAERLDTATPAEPGHPYARDLDVCGDASLLRLLGPVTSALGRRTLRSWLLSPADPGVAAARAEAAAALAPEVDLRMELAVRGRMGTEPGAGPARASAYPDSPPGGRALEGLLEWAEEGAWTRRGSALMWAAWLLPVPLVAAIVLYFLAGWPLLWVGVAAMPHLLLLKRYRSRMAADFQRVEAAGEVLGVYAPQMEALASWTRVDAGAVRAIVGRLGGGAAHEQVAALSRLADTVASRRNMAYAVVAPVFLLDFHLVRRLDGWRERWGGAVRDWLEALGEAEALSALATAAHDHPDWSFATWLADGEARLEGRALGHPLLPPDVCVRNDVEVGPPGTFLLVTGSNMSGKSTLLRALGANAVLAAAGAPVCAGALALTPMRVWTSMRVDDSLAQGVSLFMAELMRVKAIVEAARRSGEGAGAGGEPGAGASESAENEGRAGGPPVLYLLDEILHGTNTAERRVAARAVIHHLLEHGAVGAVSTHDLTLAEAPDLTPHARPVHFRERVFEEDGRTRLDFDYTLRPGVATTRNALRLLEAVGLTWEGGAGADEEELG